MKNADRRLLPDGIEEVLPPRAQHIEHLRRRLLDVMNTWGYDLVMPPVLENIESLLTGAGQDLDLRTFKVTDQLSGRMMGLSADTTPQVARIDAHSLAPEGIGRFCYCRTVFHTRARSLLASRTPTQIGAELYGQAGVEADVEVICLMLEMLSAAGVSDVHLDLGNVAVYRVVVEHFELEEAQKKELYELLSLKCRTDVRTWVEENALDANASEAIETLMSLQGDRSALMDSATRLSELVPATAEELGHLMAVAELVEHRYPNTPICLDVTELRGYQYHTGLVFGAYVPGYGDAVAQGGRYDETGAAFGRARPARGFSADLRVLERLGAFSQDNTRVVVAPADSKDDALWQMVQTLRSQGVRVIAGRQEDVEQADCYLQLINDQWQLVNKEPV
ncbi:MAG: ATP phosphoribosyltransferase regulatory subunit [Oceanospirillaceae bacterium]|nr:ATP phosphoribosyltransferase regulatory subunit [Oceanospirillaceae bacterium]